MKLPTLSYLREGEKYAKYELAKSTTPDTCLQRTSATIEAAYMMTTYVERKGSMLVGKAEF